MGSDPIPAPGAELLRPLRSSAAPGACPTCCARSAAWPLPGMRPEALSWLALSLPCGAGALHRVCAPGELEVPPTHGAHGVLPSPPRVPGAHGIAAGLGPPPCCPPPPQQDKTQEDIESKVKLYFTVIFLLYTKNYSTCSGSTWAGQPSFHYKFHIHSHQSKGSKMKVINGPRLSPLPLLKIIYMLERCRFLSPALALPLRTDRCDLDSSE